MKAKVLPQILLDDGRREKMYKRNKNKTIFTTGPLVSTVLDYWTRKKKWMQQSKERQTDARLRL
jgi:hypothetical protein